MRRSGGRTPGRSRTQPMTRRSPKMSTTTTRIPTPVYAVAGAGELAYRQLLKLPAVTAELQKDLAGLRAELPGRVADLRAELPARVEQLRSELPARVEQLRSELPARVEQLRSELPAAVNGFVADAASVY